MKFYSLDESAFKELLKEYSLEGEIKLNLGSVSLRNPHAPVDFGNLTSEKDKLFLRVINLEGLNYDAVSRPSKGLADIILRRPNQQL
ncbi:hypothetical protein COU54_04895 [Candidatus Pacearchaeota archaeon CG10_big_fil_rev_8_21_14_0_10_31_24]|nr:MAG: hypothetical protein COU54_04895 [Candidatus Pacearchaeota archaeon CG10_big_fil_rev_8_21_14_0_10_31_24]